MKYILLITLLIFPLHSASAQTSVPFNAAISLWLEGNDVDSLPVISQFAKDGNTEAQIFLARITRSSSFTSDYVRALSRKDRIALFRQPAGLSGTSWLKAAAVHSDLATAFIDANSIGNIDSEKLFYAAVALIKLGERRAGFIAYNSAITWMDSETLVRLHMQDALPPEFGQLFRAYKDINSFLTSYSSKEPTTDNDTKALRAKLRAQYGDIWEVAHILGILNYAPLSIEDQNNLTIGRTLVAHGISSETLLAHENWLLASPARRTISLPCQRACPNEVGACVRVAHWMLLIKESLKLGSPMETLISQDRYLSSERAMRDLAYAWVNRFRSYDVSIPQDSVCFANIVATELLRR